METLTPANRTYVDRHDGNALIHGSPCSPTQLILCIPPIDLDQTALHDVEHTRRMPRPGGTPRTSPVVREAKGVSGRKWSHRVGRGCRHDAGVRRSVQTTAAAMAMTSRKKD